MYYGSPAYLFYWKVNPGYSNVSSITMYPHLTPSKSSTQNSHGNQNQSTSSLPVQENKQNKSELRPPGEPAYFKETKIASNNRYKDREKIANIRDKTMKLKRAMQKMDSIRRLTTREDYKENDWKNFTEKDKKFMAQVYICDLLGCIYADIGRTFNKLGFPIKNPYSEYAKTSENLDLALLLDNIVGYTHSLNHYYDLIRDIAKVEHPIVSVWNQWRDALIKLDTSTIISREKEVAILALTAAIKNPVEKIPSKIADLVFDLIDQDQTDLKNDNHFELLQASAKSQEAAARAKELFTKLYSKYRLEDLSIFNKPLLSTKDYTMLNF